MNALGPADQARVGMLDLSTVNSPLAMESLLRYKVRGKDTGAHDRPHGLAHGTTWHAAQAAFCQRLSWHTYGALHMHCTLAGSPAPCASAPHGEPATGAVSGPTYRRVECEQGGLHPAAAQP